MADDTMRRRREIAAAAFTARRGDLGLTQQQVADAARVHVRTVQNLESGRWPQPAIRARLEKAVGWPAGELHRLSLPPVPFVDRQLQDRAIQLTREEREYYIRWLQSLDGEGPAPARIEGGMR